LVCDVSEGSVEVPFAVDGLEESQEVALVLGIEACSQGLLFDETKDDAVGLEHEALLFLDCEVLLQFFPLFDQFVNRCLEALECLFPEIRSINVDIISFL
jgi:hypothetical protein